MTRRRRRWLVYLVALGLLGCGAAPLAGTGAREAAQAYFEALIRRDWPTAYTLLHPESRRRLTADEFAGLAAAYRRRLGFEPEEVRIRACEEHGQDATAHVVIAGRLPRSPRHFKDALTLKRDDGLWKVVLPPKAR
jgi:hypothetical protein